MKIYTRTGDSGETSLFGGGRVAKDDPRVTAYGTLDEVNACLGLALRVLEVASSGRRLASVQHDLFALGAHLAAPPRKGRKSPELPPLPEGRVAEMEEWMDEADARLPPLKAFILPGGSQGAAELHVCRTVCRRAERTLLPLVSGGDPGALFAMRYLNRLSDLLFVLARLENLASGTPEVEWVKDARS
ncbi:MAG: cob(I)yrinic acid a,c-diamide adenosyltransferase [Gemmatimonadetes bacterium]|nr:cob(I)yrinic acid a,c-diamide adenosyltransferase [Gemmatimonadota bacterium]